MKRCTSRALALAVLLSSSVASAQSGAGDKALAKEAYDRGTQAHARGDMKRAAEEFARADALAPSPVALQAALDAAVDADDPVLGADLLDRSKRGKPSGALAASIDAATKKLGGRAGRVKVTCPGGSRCASKLDGAAFDPGKGVWARVGPHSLVIDVDGTSDTRTVEVRASEDLEVVPGRNAPPAAAAAVTASPTPATTSPAPPATSAAPGEPRAKPLPPAVFFVGAGVTVVLGGVATVFGITAKNAHDDFTGASCDVVATGACQGIKDEGESAQSIANIGFAATAVAGVATVVIGVFFTDWARASKSGRAPVLVPIAGGMAAGYSLRF